MAEIPPDKFQLSGRTAGQQKTNTIRLEAERDDVGYLHHLWASHDDAFVAQPLGSVALHFDRNRLLPPTCRRKKSLAKVRRP
jgi:hypothetical protein